MFFFCCGKKGFCGFFAAKNGFLTRKNRYKLSSTKGPQALSMGKAWVFAPFERNCGDCFLDVKTSGRCSESPQVPKKFTKWMNQNCLNRSTFTFHLYSMWGNINISQKDHQNLPSWERSHIPIPSRLLFEDKDFPNCPFGGICDRFP